MSPQGPSTSVGRADALRGRVLDRRYRIGDRIARGGMATVYRALDLRLDREVAVKVMHPGLADDHGHGDAEGFAERLAREARAAARLSHPNVVSVFDQGREAPGGPGAHDDAGVVWLAMELVEGGTLRDVVDRRSPLPPARALALLEPVVAALAAAHAAGVVHRDVKPENVLIADDGRVKVADFGLARAVGAESRQTATQGVLVGTVSYLAPELVTEGRADARADVYAVGVMAYELLTGVRPHVGETAIQVAYRHVHHDVPAPSDRAPGVPAYVDALVARATARDTGLRPADAGVLLRQLRRVQHALADGVRDDPDLVLDLAPPAPRTETTPEPWAEDELAALGALGVLPARSRGPEHTQVVGPDDVPPPASRRPRRGPGPRGPRRRPRGLLLLVAGVVLALLVGGGAYWFGWGRYATAPTVVGLGQVAAERELGADGLDVAYADPVFDPDVRTGSVVSADPAGGDRVLSDGTVTLTLSLGPLLVPAVRDLDEDAAQDALLERQLDFGESIERWSESRPAGTVLGSRPSAGTELAPGETVDLLVSRGRRPITVEDWVGRSADVARAGLESRDFVVATTDVYSDDVPDGVVVAQDPPDGTLNRGDTVTLEVSQGPALVEVPRVAASRLGTAQQALEDAGFVVVLDASPEFLGLGLAARTDPPAGTMVPRGSTITLFEI